MNSKRFLNSFLWWEAALSLFLCIITSKTAAIGLLFISLLSPLMWNCRCFITGPSHTLMKTWWPLFIMLCCLGTQSSLGYTRRSIKRCNLHFILLKLEAVFFFYTSFSEWLQAAAIIEQAWFSGWRQSTRTYPQATGQDGLAYVCSMCFLSNTSEEKTNDIINKSQAQWGVFTVHTEAALIPSAKSTVLKVGFLHVICRGRVQKAESHVGP